ncbi:MAG: hypothetical protein ACOX8Q_03570 [Christensenellales bacterium]|jgi:hypothetical protein
MRLQELKERITSLTQDVEFTYAGSDYLVIPYNQNKFVMVKTPDQKDIQCDSFDMLASVPFFDGKSLTEDINEVELI